MRGVGCPFDHIGVTTPKRYTSLIIRLWRCSQILCPHLFYCDSRRDIRKRGSFCSMQKESIHSRYASCHAEDCGGRAIPNDTLAIFTVTRYGGLTISMGTMRYSPVPMSKRTGELQQQCRRFLTDYQGRTNQVRDHT